LKDNYITAIVTALKMDDILVNVSDRSENYFDLESSRTLDDIIEATEGTDEPVVHFFRGKEQLGYMLVAVGYGDESIIDYSDNEFMNSIVDI
jgi:hypothetical protein